MMKKFLYLTIAALALIACGDDDHEENNPPQKHSPSPWCPLSQGKIFLKVEKELNFHFFAAAADVKASAAV